MALNMLRLDAKFRGFSPLIFVKLHFEEIGIAALPLGLKPRRVEKFQECRSTVDGESELTDEKEETCAKHKDRVRRTGDIKMPCSKAAPTFVPRSSVACNASELVSQADAVCKAIVLPQPITLPTTTTSGLATASVLGLRRRQQETASYRK